MSTGNYKRILVAVDFEPNGEPVLKRAQQMGSLCGAQLTLLHVAEQVTMAQEYLPLGFGGELSVPDELGVEEKLMDLARQQLDGIGERLGVSTEDRLVRLGSPGHTIDEVATEIGADLVIVGSRGQHGLLGLFGNTAKAVLRSVPCDVLCVKITEGGGAGGE